MPEMIGTARGEMPLSALRKEVIREDVPCGISKTTAYYAEDGALVRQDVEIEVDLLLVPEFDSLFCRTGEESKP